MLADSHCNMMAHGLQFAYVSLDVTIYTGIWYFAWHGIMRTLWSILPLAKQAPLETLHAYSDESKTGLSFTQSRVFRVHEMSFTRWTFILLCGLSAMKTFLHKDFTEIYTWDICTPSYWLSHCSVCYNKHPFTAGCSDIATDVFKICNAHIAKSVNFSFLWQTCLWCPHLSTQFWIWCKWERKLSLRRMLCLRRWAYSHLFFLKQDILVTHQEN